MRLGLFTSALLLCACDRRPEAALCAQVERCEHAQLIVEENVCTDQAQLVLEDEGPDCQRCVVGLRCAAIEAVLSGKNKIRNLCPACTEALEVPLVEGSGMLFLTPGIVYVAGEQTVETKPDDVALQAEAVCTQGEECDGAQLLLNHEECVRQVGSVLVTRDPECRVCASSLSCAGILAVIQGEQKLSSLCTSCGALIDGHRSGPPGPGGPYLLISGLVAMPPPPPEPSGEAPAAPVAGPEKPATVPTPPPAAAPAAAPAKPTPGPEKESSAAQHATR